MHRMGRFKHSKERFPLAEMFPLAVMHTPSLKVGLAALHPRAILTNFSVTRKVFPFRKPDRNKTCRE